MTIEGLLGKKLGMLQIFDEEGRQRGVTAVEVGPCFVSQIKSPERDGYSAIQIAYEEVKAVNKPEAGHLSGVGRNLKHVTEFPTSGETSYAVGDQIGVELFEPGINVDVTATSKGRGFAGVVKRHHFAGGPKTHGQSDRHRAPGSIGAGTSPGRVFKGTKMAGHMGAERSTVLNLEVVARNDDRGVIFVAGSVPGPNGGVVRVRLSVRGRGK